LGHIVDWLRTLSKRIAIQHLVLQKEDPWMIADNLDKVRRPPSPVPPSIFDTPGLISQKKHIPSLVSIKQICPGYILWAVQYLNLTRQHLPVGYPLRPMGHRLQCRREARSGFCGMLTAFGTEQQPQRPYQRPPMGDKQQPLILPWVAKNSLL
jgi:hypothetical protein